MVATAGSAEHTSLPDKEAVMFHLSPRAAPQTPPLANAVPIPKPEPEPEREPGRGCGWFDSSHELKQGLQVQEHASLAELSELLPLADWLQLHLSSWQPATLPGARLCA